MAVEGCSFDGSFTVVDMPNVFFLVKELDENDLCSTPFEPDNGIVLVKEWWSVRWIFLAPNTIRGALERLVWRKDDLT